MLIICLHHHLSSFSFVFIIIFIIIIFPGTTKGVTIGEATRYLRTNSEPKKFSKMMLHHKRNLAKRGYPKTRTTSQLRQIKFSTRAYTALKDTTLKSKHTDTPIEQQKPTFVTRYCPNARRAFKIVHRHWTSIHTDIPLLKRFLWATPRLAYKYHIPYTLLANLFKMTKQISGIHCSYWQQMCNPRCVCMCVCVCVSAPQGYKKQFM